ncbi:hypothetical protein AJ78_03648 [Emergomyces pasteurianus Ep9510]|uniref:AMP-activated protein kinase glycogen-binding domain-containing protein n=1 Tax=Emergomyces pasteurianus Ep9510 TaxID=1447872 RepID=A0A1J9QJ00_9EURO|nr:hypothetical protein AJ78_03648 [Emergomyces pasteurianus Ep9510]
MADDTRSTINVAIRRSSKTPAIFLAASFTEPAWEPVELDVKPVSAAEHTEATVQTNGHVPDTLYEFSKTFEVASGKYEYKFREGLEGSWFHDEDTESSADNEGNKNNVLVVEPVLATEKAVGGAKELANEAVFPDARIADGTKVDIGYMIKEETVPDAPENNDSSAEPSENIAAADVSAKDSKDDEEQATFSQERETVDNKPDVEPPPADTATERKVSEDGAAEAAMTEVVMPKEVVPEPAQPAAAAQDANAVDPPPAIDKNDMTGEDEAESKHGPEPVKEPVEDPQEAPAEPKPEPAVNEQAVVDSEPEGLVEGDGEGQDAEPAEKGNQAALDTYTKAGPEETEVISDKGASIAEKPLVTEPTRQEMAIEPSVTVETEKDPANKEEVAEGAIEEHAKEAGKSDEPTMDIKSQGAEQKVVEHPVEPDTPAKGNGAPGSTSPPANEPEEPTEPDTAEPIELTTAVNAQADPELAQSQDTVAAETPLAVNGDFKGEADDKPEVAEPEPPTQQPSLTTPNADADIIEPVTTHAQVLENEAEGPIEGVIAEASVEATIPESEQLPSRNDETLAGEVTKGAGSREAEAGEEEIVVKDATAEAADPIAEAANHDVTNMVPSGAGVEPEQQKAEEPLPLPATVEHGPEEREPEPSRPADGAAPFEDIAAKSVVNHDATDIPAIEEPAVPDTPVANEDVTESDVAADIQEISAAEEAEARKLEDGARPEPQRGAASKGTGSDIPAVTDEPKPAEPPEEPVALKPEDNSVIEPEPISEREAASIPAELGTPAATNEPEPAKPVEQPAASKPEDDTIPESEPVPEQHGVLNCAEADKPSATDNPEALKSSEDKPPAEVGSEENLADTPEAVAAVVDEPAENVAAPESTNDPASEAEVVDDQSPEKSVEPQSIDNAAPAPDCRADVAAIAGLESVPVEEPVAAELSNDPAPNSTDPAQAEAATTDVPEGGKERTEPEPLRPANDLVPQLESVVQTTTSDAAGAPIEMEQIEPEISQIADDSVPEPAEPAEPEPLTKIEAVETPEASEELQESSAPESTKDVSLPLQHESVVAVATSDIPQASVEPTEPEISMDADNAVTQPAELEPEPVSEVPLSETAEIPAKSIQSEALEPTNNAVNELESVEVSTTPIPPETSAEPTGLEVLPPVDNAIVEPSAKKEVDSTVPDSEGSPKMAADVPEVTTSAVDIDGVEPKEVAVAAGTASTDAADIPEIPTAPAAAATEEEELEGSGAINDSLECKGAEETIPAVADTAELPPSVEEPETTIVPEDAGTDDAPQPSTVNITETPEVPGPESEEKATEVLMTTGDPETTSIPSEGHDFLKVTDEADKVNDKEYEVVTNDKPTNLADTQEGKSKTIATELPVSAEQVEDVLPEPVMTNKPIVPKPEETTSVPELIAAEEPEQSPAADEREATPIEVAASMTEPAIPEPNQAPKTPVELESIEPERDIEQPIAHSVTPVEPIQVSDAPREIDQHVPEIAAEQPSTEPEIAHPTELVAETVSINQQATEIEPEVSEPPASAVTSEANACASKDLEVQEKANLVETSTVETLAKGNDLESTTDTAVLELPTAEIPAEEPGKTSQLKAEPTVSTPDGSEEPNSEENEAQKEIAVEIVQPPGLKTSSYPLIETPVERSTVAPTVANNSQELAEPLETQAKLDVGLPKVPVEEPPAETNGTTSKPPMEDAPSEHAKGPEVATVVAATLTTAIVGAGIAQLVSDDKEHVTDKDIPSSTRDTPAEIVASAVETSSSAVPEITSKVVDTPSDEVKEDPVLASGTKSTPVAKVDVDATESVPAPSTAEREPSANATETVEETNPTAKEPFTEHVRSVAPVSSPVSQSELVASKPTELESSTTPTKAATVKTAPTTTEPSPASDAAEPAAGSGGAEEPRPATAGDRSVTSITIHKRENFFKALWHAIFTSFFGGIFSAFRRGRRDNPRQ